MAAYLYFGEITLDVLKDFPDIIDAEINLKEPPILFHLSMAHQL